MSLKIALLQLSASCCDMAANLATGDAACRQAKSMGADIALFPEMWSTGYLCFDFGNPDLCQQWSALAIDQHDPFVQHFQALAKSLDMAICLTFLEHNVGKPRDTLVLIDRHGTAVLTYAKVHLCAFELPLLAAGDAYPVCQLDTADGIISIGAMICFDAFFPEAARILALNGAEIILSPNSDGLTLDKLALFRTRAYENCVGFATANYWYADPREANGQSCAFDGKAFDPDGKSRDMMITKASLGEQIALAGFDIEGMRRYRESESFLGLRQPNRYGRMTK